MQCVCLPGSPPLRAHCLRAVLRMEGLGLESAAPGPYRAPSLPWGLGLHPPSLETSCARLASSWKGGAGTKEKDYPEGWALKAAAWGPSGLFLLDPPTKGQEAAGALAPPVSEVGAGTASRQANSRTGPGAVHQARGMECPLVLL